MPLPGLLAGGLMSFAPSLLGAAGLFGQDPKKKLRKDMGRLMDPKLQAQLTQQFYQQMLSSPAFSQAQGTIAAGANQTGGQLASELGRAGMTGTGTGAILSSLLPSLVGQQQAGLRTSAYSSGQNQAQNEIQQRISALGGAPSFGPSQTQQLGAGGLEAFLPFLIQMLQKNPGMLGGGASQPKFPAPMPMQP